MLTAKAQFVDFKGKSYDWMIQSAESPANPMFDAYSDDVEQGVGEHDRLSVKSGALALDVVTPLINMIGMDDYFDQRAEDVDSNTATFGRAWTNLAVHGMGLGSGADGNGLLGWEWYLQRYAGLANPGEARAYAFADQGKFPMQKVFGTATNAVGAEIVGGTLGATPENLSTLHLRRLLTGNLGRPFDCLFMDEDTYIEMQLVIEQMPGNMAEHVMDKDFGRSMLTFDGTRLCILDAAGRTKKAKGAQILAGDLDVIEVPNSGDGAKFEGFSDLDIGRNAKIDDGAGGTHTAYIIKVLTSRKVQIETDASGQILDAELTLAPTHVVYGVSCNPRYGWFPIYHKTMGSPGQFGKNYQGRALGFAARDQGLIAQVNSGRKVLTQLDWFGNFVVRSPYAVRRLSHFKLARAHTTYSFG